MSKKNKYNRPHPRRPSAPSEKATGTLARVKFGTTVPRFEDIPLGDWSGTVIEVDDETRRPWSRLEKKLLAIGGQRVACFARESHCRERRIASIAMEGQQGSA